MESTGRKPVRWLVGVGTLSIVLPVLALQGPAGAGQEDGSSKGKPAAESSTATAAQPKKEKPAKPENKGKQGKKAGSQNKAAFGRGGERAVRDWFARKENVAGLPPGLAKKEDLPPGLQRNLEKNGTLPSDQMGQIQPLPSGLASQLPKPPEGVKHGIVGGDVVLVEEQSGKVLDIIKGAVPSRKDKSAEKAPSPPAGS